MRHQDLPELPEPNQVETVTRRTVPRDGNVDVTVKVTNSYDPGLVVRVTAARWDKKMVGKQYELRGISWEEDGTNNPRVSFDGVKLTKDGTRRVGYTGFGMVSADAIEVVEVGRHVESSRV